MSQQVGAIAARCLPGFARRVAEGDPAAETPLGRLVEIGCGDGRVLDHLAGRLAGVGEFVGLDLNGPIIAEDRVRYADRPRLRFESGDALEWLQANAAPGTILMTYGGVLEYFAPDRLRELFALLPRPALLALVEPLSPGYDEAREPASRADSVECSFSHPYRRLVQEAGYVLLFERRVELEHRWILLLARRR